MTIGIPRALYFFQFQRLWKTYLEELGLEVVVSPPTNQAILELGLGSCVEGACLPLKAFVGHSRFLADQGLEQLFVPQIISVFPQEYTCPNLLGLPDLVRQYVPRTVKIISPVVDARRGWRKVAVSFLRFGLQCCGPQRALRAWCMAQAAQHMGVSDGSQTTGASVSPAVLVLGPSYLVEDEYLSGGLLQQLQRLGLEVIIGSTLSDEITAPASRYLAKPPFWTSTRRSLGALAHVLPRLSGVVGISPFGCAAEAMQGVLVRDRLKETGLPYLELYVDEHSSPVGMITRFEAFFDLLERNGRA